jgi:hypothetical protein
MFDPHRHDCLCQRCIDGLRLAREYPPPFSWKGFVAWFILVNAVMWYLTIGQYSHKWWGLW